MTLVPKAYFVVKGQGESNASPLNAFDKALWAAGIGHLNLVPVSSIIPPQAEMVDFREIPPGAITFVVMASETGVKGDLITAGIAWARGEPNGYVLEVHGKFNEDEARTLLGKMCMDVESYSGIKLLEDWSFMVETLRVEKNYGAVVTALVFVI